MFELHEMLHDNYGVCLWVALAIVVFVAMVVVAVVHAHNQNKREQEFNDKMSGIIEEQGA
ncbi:MAG: hypothetical protein GX663_00680 [Clostridiales bacterium]|nr:hypothetical protein [Clostridiales bacterium]